MRSEIRKAALSYIFLLREGFLYGLIGILVALAMLAAFLAYGNIPNRFYQVLVVSSGSMAPAINPGDLIVISRPPAEILPGMVLTMLVDTEIVTHRVIETGTDGAPITKGDANPTYDNWDSGSVSVVGLYQFRIPTLGALIQNITQENFRYSTYSWFQDVDQVSFSIAILETEPTATITPSTTPTTADPTFDPTVEASPTQTPTIPWEKSSLEFNTQGFTCDRGGIVWAVIQNTGEPMAGPVVWELYLDKTSFVSSGEVPAIGKDQFFTIETNPAANGKYKFKAFQRPGHPGKGELWSEEILFDARSCAAKPEPVTSPSPTIAPTAGKIVIEPSPTSVLTDDPEPEDTPTITNTPQPPTIEPPTPEPPTPVPPTTEPPTPEPTVIIPPTQEPTSAPDIAPTEPPAE